MAQAGQLRIIRTDKAVHFTGAIAQNVVAHEDIKLPESIAAGLHCKAIIKTMMIVSRENRAWEVVFWRKDTHDSTDPALDSFIGLWAFIAGDGLRIAGAGLYRYYIAGLSIPYQDSDDSGELHISIVNRSAAAKTADAVGELEIELGMEDTVGW